MVISKDGNLSTIVEAFEDTDISMNYALEAIGKECYQITDKALYNFMLKKIQTSLKKISYLNYMYGVAPITAKAKKFPFHIPLPKKVTIKGEVLLEHHRMIDLETKEFKFVQKAPKELTEECSAKIKLMYQQKG